jgi:hypothetical protein
MRLLYKRIFFNSEFITVDYGEFIEHFCKMLGDGLSSKDIFCFASSILISSVPPCG